MMNELPLHEFPSSCHTDLRNNKFETVTAGLNISNSIMEEFVTTRVAAAPQGQRPMVDSQDVFTMLQVFAKSNAAVLSVVDQAEHHEKHTHR